MKAMVHIQLKLKKTMCIVDELVDKEVIILGKIIGTCSKVRSTPHVLFHHLAFLTCVIHGSVP